MIAQIDKLKILNMENNKTLTEAEVSAIASRYIKNIDKMYRMYAGISGDVN
jgi:hypothetical protein